MNKWLLLQGLFWIAVYITLIVSPLVVLLIGPVPPGREFWRELSVGLGFAGLAMMALQFALTSRFKKIKTPFGEDVVYHFHRQISLVAFFLILLHPLLLFVNSPDTLYQLNLFSATWRARAGVVAVVALIILIVISLWRKNLKIEYTKWRILHAILATTIVSLAMTHVVLAGHYINTPWKKALWMGYVLAWLGILVYDRLVKPLFLLIRPYQIQEVIQERGNAWTIVLKPIGHPGIKFIPGQFAWLTAWKSPFSDTEHPFSISSSACQLDTLFFSIKELGDFTKTIKLMKPGQRVYLDGPFGAFSVDRHPHAQGYNFIAGGIGITPIMSMLRTLKDRADMRPLFLIYANNRWDEVTFREEIDEIQKHLNLKVVHVLRDPPPGWKGEQGFVSKDLLQRNISENSCSNAYHTFICGPKPMMDSVEKSLAELGVLFGNFHSERFNLV